jgi:flagellar biosynthesis component FlhA
MVGGSSAHALLCPACCACVALFLSESLFSEACCSRDGESSKERKEKRRKEKEKKEKEGKEEEKREKYGKFPKNKKIIYEVGQKLFLYKKIICLVLNK